MHLTKFIREKPDLQDFAIVSGGKSKNGFLQQEQKR
jgi:hypothetical protein